ncbi:MAG: orotidine-5'-phosphate decarboxylase [Pseudomonadota bacterium]
MADNLTKYGPLVVGIDPHLDDVPHILRKTNDWIGTYSDFLLDTVIGHTGFIKVQLAYFEAEGLAGLNALARTIRTARENGIGVIIDGKRGDIGTTCAAYARAYLKHGADFEGDCLTVNPLLGGESLMPFVEAVNRYGKGLFVLCRTSNPGADTLQTKQLQGEPVYLHLARLIGDLTAHTAQFTMAQGKISPIGAVIGATADPKQMRQVRDCLPTSPLLTPGVGAQGGQLDALRALTNPGVALVPLSRGLTKTDDLRIENQAYQTLIRTRITHYRDQLRTKLQTTATTIVA